MAIRMPSGKEFELQVEKEAQLLPIYAQCVTFPITEPFATGKPTELYPYIWSINIWLEGETIWMKM